MESADLPEDIEAILAAARDALELDDDAEYEVEVVQVSSHDFASQIVAALTLDFQDGDESSETAYEMLYELDPVAAIAVMFGMFSSFIDSVAGHLGVEPVELVKRLGIAVAKSSAGLECTCSKCQAGRGSECEA